MQREDDPLLLSRKYLKAPVIELGPGYHTHNATFYKAVTAFGNMTLIWEKGPPTQLTFYQQRKQTLLSPIFLGLFPLIYEQEVIEDKQSSSLICMSLVQQVEATDLNYYIRQIQAKELILSAMEIESETHYVFQEQHYSLRHILVSTKTKNKYFDFTKLVLKKQNHAQQRYTQIFAQKLVKLFSLPKVPLNSISSKLITGVDSSEYRQEMQIQNDALDEVIIIKDKVYRPNLNLISNAIYWFELSVWFNLTPKTSVTTLRKQHIQTSSPLKKKQSPIWKLNGNPTIAYRHRTFKDFFFIDGKCINILEEISVDQMRVKFFRKNILYVVERTNNTIVRKYEQINPQGVQIVQSHYQKKQLKDESFEIQMGEDQDPEMSSRHKRQKTRKRHFTLPNLPQLAIKQPTDTIVIEQNVPKIECINFFLTYLNYVTPVLSCLEYFPVKNSLRLHLSTQVNPLIVINLIFHPSYLVKDEEISMIIEKSEIKKCQLLLSKMNITDSLLLFLSNSDKASNIRKLDISGCVKLSESGVNSLLVSPYTKDLEQINLSQLPLSEMAIEAISYRLKRLNKLKINHCTQLFDTASLQNLALHTLQAVGMKIELNFAETLTVLKIDFDVELDFLKILKNMRLTQLKIRLVDNKKHITSFFGNFGSKDTSAIKSFAEGNCKKSLKLLDLSHSTVKLKSLKALINMESLQTLLLEYYQKIGSELDHLSGSIVSLSLNQTPVNIQQFSQLVSRNLNFKWLNIVRTDIKKQQIIEFLYTHKKQVEMIEISEQQYTNKFLDRERSVVQSVKVHVARLLSVESEYIFNHMLFKASQSNKSLYLANQNQSLLLLKVKKYLINASAQLPTNIYINDKVYYEIKQKKVLATHNQQYIECEGFKTQRWLNDQPIDSLTYHFVKTIRENPSKSVGVYIFGNRVLGPECMDMISVYGASQILWIDFRNCIFRFNQVSSKLFRFPCLQKVNQGSYELVLNGHSFVQQSQKYLKFFMKIDNVNSLELEISDVREAEILYSVLYHVIDRHHDTLYELSIDLKRDRVSKDAITFWSRVFELRKLRSLKIRVEECPGWKNIGILNSINEMNLHNLQLKVPSDSLPLLQIAELTSLSLCIDNEPITDSMLGKTLKHLPSLKSLALACDHCLNITSLNKLNYISKLSQLNSLSLSFEYCHLKESSLFDFIDSLKELNKLQTLEIDISFTTQNWSQLVKSVERLKDTLVNTYIKIIAVNQTSKDYVFNRQQLSQKGVELLM